MPCYCEKLHILLVEDTPVIQQIVKTMLERMNCFVSVASNFTEALKKFNSSFDGILADVGLPDGNGFDVVKHIHQNFPENKATIYMYSAFGTEYIKERAKHLVVNGYFGKPFEMSDIRNFVNAVFENKKIVAVENSH